MIKLKCISLVFLFLSGFSVFAQQTSPLTFSEIMFYPSESNGEFIEIFNTSLTDTVDISGYKIKYYTSSNNNIVSFIGGTKLAPQKFAVVLQGNYDFNNGIYKTLIPSDAIVLKVSSNNFGSSGMANTTSRTIYLIEPSGQTVDTYTYSADNSAGISDEKIILNKDNSSSNWQNSLRTHGTPGFKNSVSPTDYDLQIKFVKIEPLIPRAEDSLKITFAVINKGRLTANNFSVSIFNDMNHDSIEQTEENIFYKDYSELISGDSIVVQKSFYVETPGNYTFMADINFLMDEVITNNRAIVNVNVEEKLALYNDVVINEIMYAPINDEPEWIELYNRSNRKINLKNWKIADNSSSVVISTNDIFIDSNQYLIISKDVSINNFYNVTSQLIIKLFPTLNNTGDDVVLKDSEGRTIDSVRYNPSWGGSSGKSLERISTEVNSLSSSNWGTSVSKEKATPGKINSITKKNYDVTIVAVSTSQQLIYAYQPLHVKTIVKNVGKEPVSNLLLKVYDDKLSNNIIDENNLIVIKKIEVIKPDTQIEIDIVIDSIKAGKNNFIFYLDYESDEFTDNNFFIYQVNGIEVKENLYDIVINEIMYAPSDDEPEWIELFNRSNKIINLKNWKVGDSSTLTEITSRNYELKPDEYLVISRDSSIINFYPTISKLIVCPLPILNNSGDAVIVNDVYNRTIDSLRYYSNWGGINGKSLERIDVNVSSLDSSNWRSSLEIRGTPERKNSVASADYDLEIYCEGISPQNPVIEDTIIVRYKIKNKGKLTAEKFLFQLYHDLQCDSILNDDELIQTIDYDFLNSNDSLKIDYKIYANAVGENCLTAKIIFNQDEKVFNNAVHLKYKVLEKPRKYNDVVINEIMYAPSGDEPEWVELFNRSDEIINLKNWKVGDNSSLTKITAQDYLLQPKEYLIITKDSSILNYYPFAFKLIKSSFPTLNNTGDAVVIKDSYNRTIDSVMYFSDWGTSSNKSLERKNVDLSSNDKNNWSSSKSRLNGTPGRINSISQKNYDVAVESFFSKSNYAEIGKSFVLTATIKNIGKQKAENLEVQVYKDENINNFIDEPMIEKKEILVLESNQGLQIEFTISNVISGQNQFILSINYQLDEYEENNTAIFKINGLKINEVRNDIVINEIMYAPIIPEPEWIELYNRSEKEIDVKNYQIKNEISKSTIIKTSRVVKPGEYLVIAKDTNIYSIYSGLNNVVISNFPILNNNGGMIVISDSLGRVIDSVYYKSTWGGRNGKSLERIDANVSSLDSVNWQSSKFAKGGTPNKSNSASKKNFDLAIVNYAIHPNAPLIGENVNLIIEIGNYGKLPAEADLIIYEITNSGKKRINEIHINELFSDINQKLEIKDFISKLSSKKKYEALINLLNVNEAEDDTANNSIAFTVYPGYNPNSVLVNEIMYNPINGEPEWLEIFNTTDYDIDLEGWSITDVLTNPLRTKIKAGIVPKNSFAVISKDSSIINYHKVISSKLIINNFANLNNDADGIVIKDYYDKTIDSVFYEKSWGGENGKSLERKSLLISSLEKNNWGSSVDIELSSPGRVNSISGKTNDIKVKEILFEPEFPAAGEQIKLFAKVFNCGLNIVQNFVVQFYLQNENMKILFDEVYGTNLSSGDSILVASNKKLTLNDDIKIICKAIMQNDEDTLNNYSEKEIRISSSKYSVLINEIMFNPAEGESEWIEIVNVSNHPINLKNWYVSDLLPSPAKSIITKEDEYLQPNEYALLISDTAKFPYYPSKKFFQTKFGTLNNTSDGIIIYDFNGRMIDSVFYNSMWGNKKGYSLERISFAAASTDSTNWSLSLSKERATPAYENSINNISTYKKNSIVINEIMYEPASDNSEFIEFINTTNDTIQIGGMNLIFGKSGKAKLSDTYLLIMPNSFFIIANDSSIYKNYSALQPDDMVIINNSLSLSNDGCELILKDIKDNTIDSVYYSPNWHNKNILSTKNKSLERINPYLDSNDKTNWSTSVSKEGATPLKQNSIYTAVVNSESKVTISPNPFSPDNDGFEDFTTINFDLPFKISQVRIRVYDSQGRLVRTLTHNMPAASHNSIIFDGLDDNGRPLRIGIYILLIEVANENGNTEVIKKPIVVARKL